MNNSNYCSVNVIERINSLGKEYMESGKEETKEEIILHLNTLYQEKIDESWHIKTVRATEKNRIHANETTTEFSNETIRELLGEKEGYLQIKVTIKRKSCMFLGRDLGNMRIDNIRWSSWIDNYRDSCYKKTLIEYFMDQISRLQDILNPTLDNEDFLSRLSKNEVFSQINQYAKMYAEEKINGATAWTDNAQIVWALSCGLFPYNTRTGKYTYRFGKVRIEYGNNYYEGESVDPAFEKIKGYIHGYNEPRAFFTTYLAVCMSREKSNMERLFNRRRRIDENKFIQITSLEGPVSDDNDTGLEEFIKDANSLDPVESIEQLVPLVNMAKWLSDFSRTIKVKKKNVTPKKRTQYCVAFANDFVKEQCPDIFAKGLESMLEYHNQDLNEMFGLKYMEEEKKRFSICHAYIQYLDASRNFENEEKVIEYFRKLKEYSYIDAYDIFKLWARRGKLNEEKINEKQYLAQYYGVTQPMITYLLQEYNEIKRKFFL